MHEVDIEHFFLSSDVGSNLEDDRRYSKLNLLAEIKSDKLEGGELPAWQEIADLSAMLMTESKDLFLAVSWTRAMIVLRGLPGLIAGITVINRYLDEYWESIHPIDEDDPEDYQIRANLLLALNDNVQTIQWFRGLSLLPPGLPVLTPRMFCLATRKGDVKLREDEQDFSREQLEAMLGHVPEEQVSAVFQNVQLALAEIRKTQRFFDERGNGARLDLTKLQADLVLLRPFFERGKAESVQSAVGHQPAPIVMPYEAESSSRAVSIPGGISSRQDVISALEKLCEYLEKNEPAHPAPLFMRRAQRLLGMNFMEIVKDLTPDSYDTVKQFRGREEEGDSDDE